jgi:hypothetical protein
MLLARTASPAPPQGKMTTLPEGYAGGSADRFAPLGSARRIAVGTGPHSMCSLHKEGTSHAKAQSGRFQPAFPVGRARLQDDAARRDVPLQ